MAAPAKIRIVLLGITGSGKSSTGNVILGKYKFKVLADPNSISKDCKTKARILNGRKISVTDTPGIFDTDKTKSEEDVKCSIISCLTECARGPHTFILVLSVGRYTKEEQQSVKMILEWFGEESLKHTVVLFTHGEDLGKNQTIKGFVERNKDLKELVDKCGGRVHVIDCKHWNEKDDRNAQSADALEQINKMMTEKRETGELQAAQALEELMNQLTGQRSSAADQEPGQGSGRPTSSDGNPDVSESRSNSFQIKELLTTIDTMVRDNGRRYYTNETLQVIAEAIETEVKKIKEEKGEKVVSSETKRRARERVRTKIWRLLAGSATGALLGALLGVPVAISIAAILTVKLLVKAVAGGHALQILDTETFTKLMAFGADLTNTRQLGIVAAVAVGASAAVGGVIGGVEGAKAADRADTVGEAAGNAAGAVWKGAWNMVKGAWEFSPEQELPSKEKPY